MNRMTISEFRNNMGVALKQLPVELWDSKSKKVVGVVSKTETTALSGEFSVDAGKSTERLVSKMPKKPVKTKEQKGIVDGLCKHGKFGYCVEGCFK